MDCQGNGQMMRDPMHQLMTEKRSLRSFLAVAIISCAIPSAAFASKLLSSGETVRVSASYYGTAMPGVPAGDDGEVGLANETVDLPNGTTAVNLGGISIAENDIRKTREGRPLLLINVYTSRKVFADNLLDCGIYQGDAALAGQVEINCKLIGE
jgi:hypothetical protein